MAIIFAPVAGIRIVRGTKWDDDVQIVDKATSVPVNLVGITSLMMRIRKKITSPILLELSLANARLVVVDASLGKIGFRVDSATTKSLPENSHRKAKYVYDAVIERTPGEYEAAIKGSLTVLPQITRPTETV